MKIDGKGYITLTPKESDAIMDLLYTLAGDHPNNEERDYDAEQAGESINKLRKSFE